MSQNLTISETGLKLIKAFEGFRPVDRELISGQRIVGYGHRLYSENAVVMNKREASEVLKTDLEPFEDMINSEVHAPMSQSQFDALCSFAFNIGPKAFLQSDTLRAINNGRPLDAANGLDNWRKSTIDGKTYVIDALMRRRTAEKALFLRTEGVVPSGREDLPPVKDTTIAGISTDDNLPVFTESDANGIVATAPYDATIAPSRRREDGLAGALQLSERDIVETDEADEIESLIVDTSEEESAEAGLGLDLDLNLDLDLDLGMESSETIEYDDSISDAIDDALDDAVNQDEEPEETVSQKSPIAAAASDIVARLDALIDDADVRFDDAKEDWPESLVDSDAPDLGDSVSEDIFSDEVIVDDVRDNVIDLNPERSWSAETIEDTYNQEILADTDEVLADNAVALEANETDLDESIEPVAVIDELAQDDAFRQRTDSAAKYIETTTPTDLESAPTKKGSTGLWIPIVLGFILIGIAGGAMIRGSELLFGQWGPIITFTGFVIGSGLILSGIYAWLRMNQNR